MGMSAASIISNLRSESIGVESVPIAPEDLPIDFGSEPIRSLYCEVGGTVTFTGLKGVEDTWDVPDNYTIPIAMQSISDASATGLHGVR